MAEATRSGSGLHARIERGFEAWGRAIYRRPRRVLVGIVAVILALGTQIPNLVFETALEEFLRDSDPLRVHYDAFRRQFGRDDMLLLAIETEDAFAAPALERLRNLHRDLEAEVPHLEEVTSLLNARETRGEGDRLIVGELMEDWPAHEAERQALRERALANRMYRNLLISDDGRLSVVTVETVAFAGAELDADEALAGFGDEPEPGAPGEERAFLSGDDLVEAVRAVEAVAARYQHPDFGISVVGTPAFQVFLQDAMQRDMARFTALGILVIAVALALLFRSAIGVILPVVVVVLSVVSTVGLLAIIRFPVGLPTTILPSFLVAVGVGYSVHVLAIYFQQQRAGRGPEDAIAGALGHSGLAVVLTALTTAGALASFAAAPLAPIAALGYAAPGGVLVALLLSLTLLPALIAIFPGRPDRQERDGLAGGRRLLLALGRFGVRRAPAVLLVTAALVGAALLSASSLHLSHDPMAWLPEQSALRRGTEFVNERLGGSAFLEVLLDTRVENGVHDPELLAAIDRARREVEAIEKNGVHAGKTLSIVDVLKEIHQALSGNDPEHYALPRERALVAQELLLFENSGSDDLEDVTDSRFQLARFTLKAPFVAASAYPVYLEAVGRVFEEALGERVDVSTTGLLVILSGTMNAVLDSLVSSYTIAFVVISVLMVALLGDLRLGLLSMLPNLAPIVLTLGTMGAVGIPLDVFTLLIGSIAIGLAVDDTIHFMHNFRRYYDQTGDVNESVDRTLRTAGQAMLFTTIVLSLGFLIFTLSPMNNFFHFGLLTALAIVLALLADLLIAPALLAMFTPGARRDEARD